MLTTARYGDAVVGDSSRIVVAAAVEVAERRLQRHTALHAGAGAGWSEYVTAQSAILGVLGLQGRLGDLGRRHPSKE